MTELSEDGALGAAFGLLAGRAVAAAFNLGAPVPTAGSAGLAVGVAVGCTAAAPS